MGGNSKKKRKKRNSSGNIESVNKQFKTRGPSEENTDSLDDTSVSTVLSEVNAVLYDNVADVSNIVAQNVDVDICNTSVFENPVVSPSTPKELNMATNLVTGVTSGNEPTNKDLMDFMKSINDRLASIESKLGTLDVLEKKVTNFEKELSKVWVALGDNTKITNERVNHVENRVDLVDMETVLLSTRVADLEKERDELREDLTYMKSQSMRNNLIFTNIPEESGTDIEAAEVTERKLRQHLQSTLKIAKETADRIRFERVHRTPGHRIPGKTRSIVAKFSFFQDRELVRRQWKELRGTNFHMFEQFPKEVSDKRRRLVKQMKEARDAGKRAWIVYDTLYVDGKQVKE